MPEVKTQTLIKGAFKADSINRAKEFKEKYKKLSVNERLIFNLERKKITKMNSIARLEKELEEIKTILNKLKET